MLMRAHVVGFLEKHEALKLSVALLSWKERRRTGKWGIPKNCLLKGVFSLLTKEFTNPLKTRSSWLKT
jgi:hypothetical protein